LWLKELTHYPGQPTSGIDIEILANGSLSVLIDRAYGIDSTIFGALRPLHVSLDGNNGNVQDFCYTTQFDTVNTSRTITVFDNTARVGGRYGIYTPQHEHGLFIATLNTLVTNTDNRIISSAPFSIFPNPTDGAVQIEIDELETPLRNIVVFDLNGRKVFSNETINKTGTHSFQLDDLSPGLYVVSITLKDGRVVSKKVAIR
ncbi:MAG: T9SS type A sorting domain-containing protein, partial [Bacteroidetes bacterium]|nr:T9SS type A sorting domain-containing protein [Bacteroidota bacterium]